MFVTEVVEVEVEVPVMPEAPEELHEAPDLHAKVEAGELPPLDERLPTEPRVLQTFDTVGTYGGTWHRFDTSLYHVGLAMYGHSPVWWVNDGLGKEPGLAKGWEANDDKSEWTFTFREGTKWSDGAPFTVDDIIFWYEDMALNPDYPEQVPSWLKANGKVAELEKWMITPLSSNSAPQALSLSTSCRCGLKVPSIQGKPCSCLAIT